MPSDPFIILNKKAEMTISLLFFAWRPFHYYYYWIFSCISINDHFIITFFFFFASRPFHYYYYWIFFFKFCLLILIYYYLVSFFNWLHWCQAYDEKVINTNNSSLNLDILDNFLLAFFTLVDFPYKLDCLYFCCNYFSELMSIFFILFLFKYFVYEDLGHNKL